ncbi:hypothetical protein RZS08_40925, partial [Arthrospira platensis SPKY1]|nr:hypothetical protein [Arthrospira platensis SPKY1]
MSLRPIFFPVLALLLLATACLPTRHIISDLPPVQLRIGSGGGGGGATEYVFLENGQVFLLESASGRQDTFELETYTWQERRGLF